MRKYDLNSIPELIDQSGMFVICGNGPVEIEFEIPFIEPPKIEIINFKGYKSEKPYLSDATIYQAIIVRTENPYFNEEKFKFIARGKVINPELI